MQGQGLHFPQLKATTTINNKPSRHLGFGETGNSAIRSADPENPTVNPTVEPNMKWIGRPLAEINSHLNFPKCEVVGRSVLNNTSYTGLIYSSSPR